MTAEEKLAAILQMLNQHEEHEGDTVEIYTREGWVDLRYFIQDN